MSHIKSILVPIDGSPASVAALAEAVALARDLDATVDTVHVVAPDESEYGAAEASAKRTKAPAFEEMDTALASAEGALHERLRRRTVTGEPIRKILEIIDDDAPDLIVMGTHGRLGRLHALVGSVAEAIVRNASCPVVTVRDHAGAESFADKVHHRQQLADRAR